MSTAEEQRWFKALHEMDTCVLCGDYGVEVSHSNMERGMGQKSQPWMTAALCHRCHGDIDSGKHLTKNERRLYHFIAICRTMSRLIEAGRLKLV